MKKFFLSKRKTPKFLCDNLESLEDSPGSFEYESSMGWPKTRVNQADRSSSRRYESRMRYRSPSDYEKNFSSEKFSKTKNKACEEVFNNLNKQMAIDIANEVCNYDDHKRLKSLDDVTTSNDCLETGDSSTNHEKLEGTSDCRETGKSTEELTEHTEITQTVSNNCQKANELAAKPTESVVKKNTMSSYDKRTNCRETTKLRSYSTRDEFSGRKDRPSSINEVLKDLEALIPDIYEAVKPAKKLSSKKCKTSRKNKLYRGSSSGTLMSNNDLAKKLRNLADTIEGVEKTPKLNIANTIKKSIRPAKAVTKLIALMGGEHESISTPKLSWIRIKILREK